MIVQLEVNGFDAAIERLEYVFEHFERVCVSFSGGKDSTVLLHLARTVAARLGRTVDVLFIDWEAQYQATIDHVTEMLVMAPVATGRAYWVQLPISTSNESSFHEPMWTAWDADKRDVWVRPLPMAVASLPNSLTGCGGERPVRAPIPSSPL